MHVCQISKYGTLVHTYTLKIYWENYTGLVVTVVIAVIAIDNRLVVVLTAATVSAK